MIATTNAVLERYKQYSKESLKKELSSLKKNLKEKFKIILDNGGNDARKDVTPSFSTYSSFINNLELYRELMLLYKSK